MMLKWVGKSEH